MLPVTVRYGDWSYRGDLPQTLAEVPSKHLRPTMRDLLRPANELSYGYCCIACRLMDIPSKWWRRMPTDVRTELVSLVTDLGFGDASPAGLRGSSTPLIEEFKHNGVTYVLAKAEGNNVRAAEFAFADGYLEDFAEDPSEMNMLRIIATYAREESYDVELSLKRSDRRVPIYSRDEVDARAKELKGIPPEIATAVFTYAIGLKIFIKDLYDEWLFGGSPDPDDEDNDTEPEPDPYSDDPNFGWWGIYMRIAKEGVFGDLESVHQSFFHDICAYLVQEEVQARRNKKATTTPKFEE